MNSLLIRSHFPLHNKNLAKGAGRLMINIANALSRSQWDVDILCPKISGKDHNYEPSSWQIYEFSYSEPKNIVEKAINTVRGVSVYNELVKSKGYDIILDDVSHIPYLPAHYLTPYSTKNAVFLHTALLNSARKYNGMLKGSIVNAIDLFLPYLSNPEIICAGSSTQSRIEKATGYEKTHILNPCVNIEDYEFRTTPHSKKICYIGSLSERKNVLCLLKAWKKLQINSNRNGHELLIAGSGPQKNMLENYVEEYELESVDLLGYIKEEDKRKLLGDSRAMVIPSLMEGYVTVGLEALASGCLVIGSDTFGINDYIQDGKNGLLFENNNHEELAKKLAQVTSESINIEELVLRGKKTATAHSFDRFVKKSDEVFSRLL